MLLLYYVTKFKKRFGWTHKDLLCLSQALRSSAVNENAQKAFMIVLKYGRFGYNRVQQLYPDEFEETVVGVDQNVARVVNFIRNVEELKDLGRTHEERLRVENKENKDGIRRIVTDDTARCCEILSRNPVRWDQPPQSYEEKNAREPCALVIEHVPKRFQGQRQVSNCELLWLLFQYQPSGQNRQKTV